MAMNKLFKYVGLIKKCSNPGQSSMIKLYQKLNVLLL